MQITESNAEGLKHELTVVVDADDIKRRIEQRLVEIGRSVNLPGFRPGKVPMGVLRKRYGTSVMGEVLERAVSDSSVAAMEERKLRPALQPKVEILSFQEGTDLQYKMALEVLPEIEGVEFGSLTLERLKPDIADSEIDSALERIAKQQRKSEPVERAAATGDIAVIDFVGSVDGTPFPGGSAEGHELELGSGSFIPGFEEQLVGASAGEQKTVEITFPEDYGSTELAGKKAQFAVTVKEVRAMAPMAIDDSLASAVGMENLEELRKAVRERIERDYVGLARQRLKRQLLDQLAERHHFPVPEGMVDIEFETIWKQYEAERDRVRGAAAGGAVEAVTPDAAAPEPASPEGASPEAAAPAEAAATASGEATDEAQKPEDEAKAKAEYRAIAERRVRLGLLLSEVGRTNNLTVSQEEVNRAIAQQTRRFPGQERQVFDYYRSNPAAVDALRAPIYEEKVVDFILEMAQVTDRAIPAAELMAELQGEELDGDEDAAEGTA